MKKVLYIALTLSLSVTFLNSCRDADLEPTLGQSQDIEISINNVEDVEVVLNSAYNRMSDVAYYGRDYVIFGEVRSDNTFANGASNRFITVGQMNMLINDAYASDTWTRIYGVIAIANIIIGLDESSLDIKTQAESDLFKHLKGQAYAIRANAHFDLVKLFGQQHVQSGGMSALGVPYVKVFRGEPETQFPTRNTVQEVYNEAIADFDQAFALMDESQDASAHYLTKYGAAALKSRMALYFKDYTTAETAAKQVIDSGKYSISTAANYFSTWNTDFTNNQIFSIANSNIDNQGNNSLFTIYQGAYGDIEVLENLYNIYESTDIRKSGIESVDGKYRNLKKYPVVNGQADIPVIRYEEVILNYAEALLNKPTPNVPEALIQLNKIPTNRGATAYSVVNMDNILLERRKELAFEGHRFYDLARTNKDLPLVDPINQAYGDIQYGNYKYAFPIPNSERGANSNIEQNYGY